MSSGLKPLAATQYYTRLTQRLISAFTAPTAEGILYEVDMRLRPSGQKGPVATQLSSFIDYQAQRGLDLGAHGPDPRPRRLRPAGAAGGRRDGHPRRALTAPRDRAKTAADVRDMRARIEKEKGTRDPWELKQVRGGLVDLEFIAQHLQLVHAADHPQRAEPEHDGGTAAIWAARRPAACRLRPRLCCRPPASSIT